MSKEFHHYCGLFVLLVLVFIEEQSGFFIKHSSTGLCLKAKDTRYKQTALGDSYYYLEFTKNCSHPKAQFRFTTKGHVESIALKGIVLGVVEDKLDGRFKVLVNKSDEAKKIVQQARFKIKQTKSGSLTQEVFIGKKYCVTPASAGLPSDGNFVYLDKKCDLDIQRFTFGSNTCENEAIQNVNCYEKEQVIVIQNAWYGTRRSRGSCDYTGEFDCAVSVTCLVKKKCEGHANCSFIVDYNLPGYDPCFGIVKSLYIEYNCASKMEKNPVKLISSTVPNEGFLQTRINTITSHVCNKSLTNKEREIICAQLGYLGERQVNSSTLTDTRSAIFAGKISCSGQIGKLSECCFDRNTKVEGCIHPSYISCLICSEQLLVDQQNFPDSLFSASSSLSNHGAPKARISSNSSWCAPSDGDHFLNIDLGKGYIINSVATFGDTAMPWWISSYKLNYTLDGVNWMVLRNKNKKEIDGNKDAFNDVAILKVNNIQARVLRFIPTKSSGRPCMRVEICGHTLYPDSVNNLSVTKITSTSVAVSWDPPLSTGDKDISGFHIKLINMKSLVRNFNITSPQTTQYDVTGLSPYTEYELTVAAGNVHGFGEERTVNFTTAEDGKITIKPCQCSSKTLLHVVVGILVVIISVESLALIYMCFKRQKHYDPKNDKIVARVDNKTFSEGNYEQAQVACSSTTNIEKNNSSLYEELHHHEEEQEHTYQPLSKKAG